MVHLSDMVTLTVSLLKFSSFYLWALVFSGPLNNAGDFFGVAFAWGDPVQDSLRSQYVVETLYRIQITPIAQLTPDIQIIVNPTNNPNEDILAVFGIRLIISL